MAWNQSEQKTPQPSGGGPNDGRYSGRWLLQHLNCFAGNRFHPLRFSVLLAVVLVAVSVVHELPVLRQMAEQRGLVEQAAAPSAPVLGDAAK
ncbi:MAG: hypothetical protein ACRERR_09690 [Moraxellaceae bacterium]